MENNFELTEEEKKLVQKIIYEYTLTVKPSQEPTIHFLVAPPGAGKTGMEIYLKNKMQREGEDTVQVGADKLATYHPDYEKWLQLPSKECYKISRRFTGPASQIIYPELRKKHMNMIYEKTFHKGEKDLELVKKFKDAGYKVYINIMATDKYESLLSCYERDIKSAEIGLTPRPIARENFDKMYNHFLSEIITMEQRGLCDSVRVFTRGKKMFEPNLVYQSGDSNYMNVYQAVEEERKKQRRKVLGEGRIIFQKRICEAIQNTKNVISNDKIREQSLEGLYRLQREYFQELSQDMNLE